MTQPIILGVGDEIMRREGLAPEPQPWEDGLRAGTGPGSFEWWYFDAHFDDGSTAVIVYYTKPLLQRGDPLTPTLSLTLTRPDGSKVSAYPLYPASEFHASRERCDVRIAASWVHDDAAGGQPGLRDYTLHAEAAGLAADLAFHGIAPAWRPGSGKNYYSDDLSRYFAWLPAIPFGKVEGTLTYDGRTRRVTGAGYHDHNWGNIGLETVMSHWFWGRVHLGEYTAIFVEMVAADAYGSRKLPVFMLARGDRLLVGDGSPLKLETGDWTDGRPDAEAHRPSVKAYPRRLDFRWETDEGCVHVALRQAARHRGDQPARRPAALEAAFGAPGGQPLLLPLRRRPGIDS